MPENTNKVIQLQDTEGNDVSPVVNVGSIYDKNGQKIDNLLSYVVAGTDVPIPDVGNITDDLQDQVDQMVSTATSQVNEMVSTATSQIDAKLDAVDEALNGIDTAVDDKLSSGGLPINDVRTYPVREGEVIHAGDVVNVGAASDGTSDTIYKDVAPQDNVENVIHTSAVTDTDTCYLNGQYSVTVVTASNSNNVFAYLIDNTTGQSISSEVITLYAGNATSISLARLDDSHFVVCYEEVEMIRFRVGTVSDTSVSFGTEYNPGWGDTDSNPHYTNIITIGTNTVFCCYNWGTEPEYALLTVSGTSISATVSRQSLANIASRISHISACRLPDEGGNKRVCICFSDTGDGNKGKAVIATISTSNAVTFSDITEFDASGSIYGIDCEYIDDRIVIVYGEFTSSYVITGAISSNGITFGTRTYISEGTFNNISSVGSSVVVSQNIGCAVLTISESSVQVGDFYEFSDQYVAGLSACSVTADKILIVYTGPLNTNYGRTTVLEVSGNQIAGSFIDASRDAIALADGTGGQEIPVGFGGYCECSNVYEGEMIDSNGIRAAAVKNGWLHITPQYKNAAFGSFVYDHNAEPTKTVNLGFKPSIVLIYNGYNNTSEVAISGSPGDGNHIPMVLTRLYTSGNSYISDDGFVFYSSLNSSTNWNLYYVAFR